MQQGSMQARPVQRGFTLVELLVALFILSLVAVLSWRGLDGMVRAQVATQARADQVLALQVGLAQWNADLEAIVPQPQEPALAWNGRVLRILRRAPAAGRGTSAWPRDRAAPAAAPPRPAAGTGPGWRGAAPAPPATPPGDTGA